MDREKTEVGNLFEAVPALPEGEFSEYLIANENVKIERIVSEGHASSENFWYDQHENEWVILLSGSAGLRFEGEADAVVLHPGDYVHIPARKKHRVEWTAQGEKTVWLAIYF